MPTWTFHSFLLVGLLVLSSVRGTRAFSIPEDQTTSSQTRRDLLWKVPVGLGASLAYGKLVKDAVGRLARGDLVYPEAHEEAVRQTIDTAVLSAADQLSSKEFKIFEVGCGSKWRLASRKLYLPALQDLVENHPSIESIQLVGLDLHPPATDSALVHDLQESLSQAIGIPVHMTTVAASLTSSKLAKILPSPPFDCVLSCLTLCSVDRPDVAIQNIHALTVGSFGFVEHVAATGDAYSFLEWQQQVLDPLQQALAENCHLHRSTQDSIAQVFQSDAVPVDQTCFIVDDMWPVSYQCRGVWQKKQKL